MANGAPGLLSVGERLGKLRDYRKAWSEARHSVSRRWTTFGRQSYSRLSEMKLLPDGSIAHVDGTAGGVNVAIYVYTAPSKLRNITERRYTVPVADPALGSALEAHAEPYDSAVDVSQDLVVVPEKPADT